MKEYGLPKSTILTIAKEKDKIVGVSINADPMTGNRLGKATYMDVEDALFKWFIELMLAPETFPSVDR